MNQQRYEDQLLMTQKGKNEALLASSLQTPSFKFQRYSQIG